MRNITAVSIITSLIVLLSACGGSSTPYEQLRAKNDDFETVENTTVELNVINNDNGSLDKSSITIINNASQGSTVIDTATGTINYTPNSGFVGTDSFSYSVNDNEGNESNTATVTITINSDLDGDGIADVSDMDDDNDGISDVQEQINGTNPLLSDSDDDGIDDKQEGLTDTDNDGIIDALDSITTDSDSDGVFDQQDTENTNPDNDTDYDGFSNAEEVLNQTDPKDGEPNVRPFMVKVLSSLFNNSDENFKYKVGTNDNYDYNYSIDCDSDGVLEALGVTSEYTCSYSTEDEFLISIFGVYSAPRLGVTMFIDGEDEAPYYKLLSIEQWGTSKFKSMHRAFENTRAMKINATDKPNLTDVNDMSYMFRGTNELNGDITNWDVSSVTDMSFMFFGSPTPGTCLRDCPIYPNDFNQDISNWDVSSVTDMSGIFSDAQSFNQDISNWDVSSVTHMGSMFDRARSFNQNISNWNVSSVTSMYQMFRGATSFNQNLSNWDVSSVTDMGGMFGAFRMFETGVQMFSINSFNQDLSNWDVSSVTDMSSMFWNATSFNQDLSNWDITSVNDMRGMFDDSNLSITNYDKLLIAWSSLNLELNVEFSAISTKYSQAAVAARQTIIDLYNWTITDAGLAQ